MKLEGHSYLARTLLLQLSFKEPVGIMRWTAQAAHWSFRNSLVQGGTGSYDGFLSVWIKFIALLSLWEPLSRFSGVFIQFHNALYHLASQGSLITDVIRYIPSNRR